MATIKKQAGAATVILTLREREEEHYVAEYVRLQSKQMIVTALSNVIKRLSRMYVRYSEQSETRCVAAMKAALENASKLETLRKSQLEIVYASFAGNIENYIQLALADSRYAKVLIDVLMQPTVTLAYVSNAMYGKTEYAYEVLWSVCKVLIDAAFNLNLMPIVQTPITEKRFIGKLPLPIDERYRYIILSRLAGADAVSPRLTESLPEEDNLRILNYEFDIQGDLARLDALRAGGLFPYGKNVTKARAAGLAGRLGAIEFPPEAGGAGENSVKRGHLEVLCYSLYNDYCERRSEDMGFSNVSDFARFVVDTLAGCMVGTSFSVMFPAFSGFTKSWAESSYTIDIVGRVQHYVSQSGSGKWLSTENFINCYLTAAVSVEPAYRRPRFNLFGDESIRKNKLRPAGENEYYKLHHAFSVDWWKDITLPFTIHWLKLMCAAGLLEIAVSGKSADNDPLEGIRYVRLTRLGRYALKLTDTYVPAKNESADWSYDLDSDGIISSFGVNPPYDLLLSKIGKQVSPHRFVVTAGSIVAGSADADDVERNVITFRSIFSPEQGSRWDAMLDEALKRRDCTAGVDKQYVLVKLKTEIPGLVETVLSDSEICRNCIKAEQGILIVPHEYYPKLYRILQRHGYLL